MKKMKFTQLIALGLMALAPLAQAVLVTTGNNAVLLADDFEAPVARGIGVLPDNGDLPGTWSVHTGQPGGYVDLRAAAGYRGTQIARLHRSRVGGGERAELRGEFAQPVSSGKISVALMVSSNFTDALATFTLSESTNFTGTDSVRLMARADGQIVRWDGNEWQKTGLRHFPGSWQKWNIEIDLATKSFALTVDGDTAADLPFSANSTGVIGYFMANVGAPAGSGQDRYFFIDAIPGLRDRVAAAPALTAGTGSGHAEPIVIGDRLELFVDELMVDQLRGNARLHLHQPEPREVVMTFGKPWEGNTSAYHTVFQDGESFRMYYRGSHFDTETGRHRQRSFTCYAESTDGIHWNRPELGLFEFDGSKDNNIIWTAGPGEHPQMVTANFFIFKDSNPAASPEGRYKGWGPEPGQGMVFLQSPDGIRWQRILEMPNMLGGQFDSLNTIFWDEEQEKYRAYYRVWRRIGEDRVRDIKTRSTTDFYNWPPAAESEWLEYPDAPDEHLYTNNILPYERAPHIYLGFPMRFFADTQQSDVVFMAGRDGRTFHRWPDAIIPMDAPEDREGNRSNAAAYGLLQLPGNDRELSLYANEAYYTGPDNRLRRFTYRLDGFVSVRADAGGGELITPQIIFEGGNLLLNFVTAEGGSVRVEVQDIEGNPIPSFEAEGCVALSGDEIAGNVQWAGFPHLYSLEGQPVRLRFILENADLYSFRFTND